MSDIAFIQVTDLDTGTTTIVAETAPGKEVFKKTWYYQTDEERAIARLLAEEVASALRTVAGLHGYSASYVTATLPDAIEPPDSLVSRPLAKAA